MNARIITTEARLRALPDHSVIEDANHEFYRVLRYGVGAVGTLKFGVDVLFTTEEPTLPATVQRFGRPQ